MSRKASNFLLEYHPAQFCQECDYLLFKVDAIKHKLVSKHNDFDLFIEQTYIYIYSSHIYIYLAVQSYHHSHECSQKILEVTKIISIPTLFETQAEYLIVKICILFFHHVFWVFYSALAIFSQQGVKMSTGIKV